MNDIPSTGKLTLRIEDSKIYKQYESMRAAIEKIKVHIPAPMYAELEIELGKLETEAHLISVHHANFYGLCKQYYQKMQDVGLSSEGIPMSEDGKPVLFKSQFGTLDLLLKLMTTLGTYYDKKK